MSMDMIVALIVCAPVLLLMWCGRKSTRSSRMFVVVALLGVMALSMVTSGCSVNPYLGHTDNQLLVDWEAGWASNMDTSVEGPWWDGGMWCCEVRRRGLLGNQQFAVRYSVIGGK